MNNALNAHGRPARGLRELMNTPRSRGLALVLLTAVVWVSASFVAQLIVQPTSPAEASMPPFLLTYICTSLFVLYLPLMRIVGGWTSTLSATHPTRTSASLEPYLTDTSDLEPALQQLLLREHALNAAAGGAPQPAAGVSPSLLLLPWYIFLHVLCHVPNLVPPADHTAPVVQVGPFWFAAQYIYTVSLAYTSVTSNTILSSTSSLFTLLLSVLLQQERFTCTKLACVCAVIAGTSLVTLADSGNSQQQQSVLGDALAMTAAGLYGLYTVIMRAALKQDSSAAVAYFFGYIGLGTALGLAPVIALLQYLGRLDVRAVRPQALGLALATGLLDYVLADYLWARAVLLLGPTAATVGMAAQVPLAAAADVFLGSPTWLQQPQPMALTAAGTVAIMLGVVAINLLPPEGTRQAVRQNMSSSSSEGAVAGEGVAPGARGASYAEGGDQHPNGSLVAQAAAVI